MKLSYFPQVEVVHTSKKFHGQVYIPLANWIMMIGTVIVTAVYTNVSPLQAQLSEPNANKPRLLLSEKPMDLASFWSPF
jgi:hypothetical protein